MLHLHFTPLINHTVYMHVTMIILSNKPNNHAFFGSGIPLFGDTMKYAHVSVRTCNLWGYLIVCQMRLCRPSVIPTRWGSLLRSSLACSPQRHVVLELKPQRGGVVLLGAFLLFAPVRLLLDLFSQFSFQHVLK